MKTRAFYLGGWISICLHGFIQDWMGLEAFTEYINKEGVWWHMSPLWWVGAALLGSLTYIVAQINE